MFMSSSTTFRSSDSAYINVRAMFANVNETLARCLLGSSVLHVYQAGTKIKDADISAGLAHVIAQRFGITEAVRISKRNKTAHRRNHACPPAMKR